MHDRPFSWGDHIGPPMDFLEWFDSLFSECCCHIYSSLGDAAGALVVMCDDMMICHNIHTDLSHLSPGFVPSVLNTFMDTYIMPLVFYFTSQVSVYSTSTFPYLNYSYRVQLLSFYHRASGYPEVHFIQLLGQEHCLPVLRVWGCQVRDYHAVHF